jgi:hypothetical protein
VAAKLYVHILRYENTFLILNITNTAVIKLLPSETQKVEREFAKDDNEILTSVFPCAEVAAKLYVHMGLAGLSMPIDAE